MIAKELRSARWPLLAGVAFLVISTFNAAQTDLHAVTLDLLRNGTDASFAAVTAGNVSAASAYVWSTFFADSTLYLFIGIGGALFGARLIADEVSSGSIFLLLSRPLSRERLLLTKYGVAAGVLLLLACLLGGVALLVGAARGVALPLGGVVISTLLVWLGTLCVLGITTVYSVVLPSSLAAGFLGFFTVYLLTILPLFHTHTSAIPGGEAWSLSHYWSNLGIYAGVVNPLPSLLVALVAALIPLLIAVLLFRRQSY